MYSATNFRSVVSSNNLRIHNDTAVRTPVCRFSHTGLKVETITESAARPYTTTRHITMCAAVRAKFENRKTIDRVASTS